MVVNYPLLTADGSPALQSDGSPAIDSESDCECCGSTGVQRVKSRSCRDPDTFGPSFSPEDADSLDAFIYTVGDIQECFYIDHDDDPEEGKPDTVAEDVTPIEDCETCCDEYNLLVECSGVTGGTGCFIDCLIGGNPFGQAYIHAPHDLSFSKRSPATNLAGWRWNKIITSLVNDVRAVPSTTACSTLAGFHSTESPEIHIAIPDRSTGGTAFARMGYQWKLSDLTGNSITCPLLVAFEGTTSAAAGWTHISISNTVSQNSSFSAGVCDGGTMNCFQSPVDGAKMDNVGSGGTIDIWWCAEAQEIEMP